MAQLKCPKCKKLTEYSAENPFRPFCSERCKMVDLGQWANEEYSLPSNQPVGEEDLAEASQTSSETDKSGRNDLH
jgi:endogenous inhibitor of DNA gyrase (YacG/DUF329 family)